MLTLNPWNITYYDASVSESVGELPPKIRARYFALTERMEISGPDLGMPHTQSMGNGLFELRIKAQEGIARAFFCLQIKREIVMLNCFVKKTQKTPAKALKIARKRLKEVKQYG